jgi:hypothetical protein
VLDTINSISNKDTWNEIINSEHSHPELTASLEDVKHYLAEIIGRLEDYLIELKDLGNG